MIGGNKYPNTNDKCWKGGMKKETSNVVATSNNSKFSAKRDPKPMNNRAGRK